MALAHAQTNKLDQKHKEQLRRHIALRNNLKIDCILDDKLLFSIGAFDVLDVGRRLHAEIVSVIYAQNFVASNWDLQQHSN